MTKPFRPPLPRTPLNALIACGRACGPVVLAVARLFTWRTS